MTRRAWPALLLAAALALCAAPVFAAPPHVPPPSYAKRPEVRAFISAMVQQHGFVKSELELMFSKTRQQRAVIKAIKPGAPGVRSWQSYRSRFINPSRIDSGVAFWRLHAGAIARAEREYGVPAEIIVAIIGVETVYGRNMGDFRVIDALSTLAFDYPKRAEFFLGELENFLLLARDSGRDVFSIKGSYAGAIGIPQFMPGSYRRYAVDFDSSGDADLRGSPADAIGSVANFLKEHGWETGGVPALPATVQGSASRELQEAGLKPSTRAANLGGMGVSLAMPLPAETLCALIPLETPGQPDEYLVGLHNFWVITRYNRSSFYAASVLELAAALKSGLPDAAK
jgi:membrane-bound lytic murein transglycosylase B